MRGAKAAPYEGGHRVPLFVHWPRGGLASGRDVTELTSHLDLFPTLVELCGLEAREAQDLDGRSLVPLLRGGTRFADDRIHFIEHHQVKADGAYQMERPYPWMSSVALTRTWRLVGGRELYQIAEDRRQERNVAAQFPDVVKKLSVAYTHWRKRMHSGFRQWTRIPVGGAADPVELTCFDWHGDVVPSSQAMVKSGLTGNGEWALFAVRQGIWQMTLRQRPSYVPFRLDGTRATVWLNGRELPPKPVSGEMTSVSFTAELPQGNVNLGTEFVSARGKCGAYYVDIHFNATGKSGVKL
jgi:hypothetical protein